MTHLIVSVINTVGSSCGSSWSLCIIIMFMIIAAFIIIIIITLSPAVMNHPEHEAGLARPAVTHQHNLSGWRTSTLKFHTLVLMDVTIQHIIFHNIPSFAETCLHHLLQHNYAVSIIIIQITKFAMQHETLYCWSLTLLWIIVCWSFYF